MQCLFNPIFMTHAYAHLLDYFYKMPSYCARIPLKTNQSHVGGWHLSWRPCSWYVAGHLKKEKEEK